MNAPWRICLKKRLHFLNIFIGTKIVILPLSTCNRPLNTGDVSPGRKDCSSSYRLIKFGF